MDAVEHHVEVWCLGPVVFENSIGLVRPHDFAGVRLPPEAARVTERLGFDQVRFASPDGALGNLAFRNVDDCANHLFVPALVPYAMSNVMKMLGRAIRHHQAM